MVIDRKLKSIKLVGSAFLVTVILTLLNLSKSELLVTASCVFPNGQIGQCVKFEECRSAVILSRKGVNPGFCNLEEGRVCCTDFQNNFQTERRPVPDYQSAYSQKRPSNVPDFEVSNIKGTYEDSNYQKKKHAVVRPSGSSSSEDNYGKKKNIYDYTEEPYKYEISSTFYSNTDVSKPIRQSNPQSNTQINNNYFVPPGIAKKKPWREEKTTENDYEYVTKKPGRGPPARKNSSKHTGNNYDTDESRKPTYEDSTKRNEWFEQGGKKPNDNHEWYDNQNEYENFYSNQRTTTKRNKWNQESYTTTRRYNPYDIGEENYGESENEYSNVKPSRPDSRPDSRPPVDPSFSQGRPNYRPQGSNRPSTQQSSGVQGNRPSHQQGSAPQNSKRPDAQQGLKPQENNRPNYHQNFDNNRPNPPKRRRISEQKCEEYSKEVTENITGLPLTTNPDPVIIPVRKCITPQQLIVGGENTTLGEFPHMAAIGFRDRNKKQIAWNCGGTLISDQFVMTAAHCTSTSSGRPVKVRLGEYNLMKNDDGAHPVEYAIIDIINHPDYRPPSKYNDIALLKLSRKVAFFKHIRPACLYVEETFTSSKAIATGWGRMYYDGGKSEILQKVVLSIVDNITCNRLYKVNVKTEVLSRGIVDSQLCAGELTGGKDTCQGDSGGPLSITSTKCVHHVIGITSFGKSCALPNSTGVYTRVSAYIPWIESVVWPSNN